MVASGADWCSCCLWKEQVTRRQARTRKADMRSEDESENSWMNLGVELDPATGSFWCRRELERGATGLARSGD